MAGREIPPATVTCLQLLNVLLCPGFAFEALEALVRKDVSLVFKLFSYVNSAQFGRAAPIESVRRALTQLGEEGIRRWVILATLRRQAKDKSLEIVTCALVRARFSETLARLAGEPNPLVYLIGLFSVLDGLLDCPLDEALRRVGLETSTVGQVLLGTASDREMPSRVYKAVLSYEAGVWDAVGASAEELGVSVSDFSAAYVEAAGWASQELRTTPSTQGSSEGPKTREEPKTRSAVGLSRRSERRRQERTPVKAALTILWGTTPGQENVARAKLVEVSARGAKFELSTQIPRGAWLAFNDQNLGIGGRGTVRYCNLTKGQYQIGVEMANGTGWGGSASKGRNADLRRLGAAIQRLQSLGVSNEPEVAGQPDLGRASCRRTGAPDGCP